MFGTKLRSWMETHIVRSRKKQQQRSKEDKQNSKQQQQQQQANKAAANCGSSCSSIDKHYDKACEKSAKHGEESEPIAVCTKGPHVNDCKSPKASMSLKANNETANTLNTLTCTLNSLSSPESAYSTGYSTDGTSPGASVPPEYYINIRTGTHYFHSNPNNTCVSISNTTITASTTHNNPSTPSSKSGFVVPSKTNKVGSTSPNQNSLSVHVVSPNKHRREDGHKKKNKQGEVLLQESSTEEDLDKLRNNNLVPQQLTPKAQNKILHPMYNTLHRRTESCDENHERTPLMFSPQHQQQQQQQQQERDSGGDSSSGTLIIAPYQCTSPYLPGASPRQRNRIRTNPWVSTQTTNATVTTGSAYNSSGSGKNYNSQGETSSTVGSSSTLSSSGCKQTSEEQARKCFSPKPKEKKRTIKEDIKDIKNSNIPSAILSPLTFNRRHLNSVTTCSPRPNHPCRHVLRQPSSSSSSPSSAPSTASEDEHHGNTSDFSDDDVTLNEMLGKYDESYVYEKETDILSDSDPTDCEDQPDYEDSQSNFQEAEMCEDLDFIDNGSLIELAHSDSECSSKAANTGHCTYHHLPGYTPEMSRKLTPRLRESLLRRQHGHTASVRSSRDRGSQRSSRTKLCEPNANIDVSNTGTSRRCSSRKKFSRNSKYERKICTENVEQKCEDLCTAEVQAQRMRRSELPGKPAENPAKYMNLNRVLMERLINNQRNGTRSADGTPISLRKQLSHMDYNGKYMRNHYVTKLINANINDRRNSLEEKNIEVSNQQMKRRSNSLTPYSPNDTNRPPTAPSSVAVGLNEVDKEGDLKYRLLIQEAEHIYEDFQSKTRLEVVSQTTLHTRPLVERIGMHQLASSLPQTPLSTRHNLNCDTSHTGQVNNNPPYEKQDFLANQTSKDVANANDESLLKTISKTLEKIIVRNPASEMNRKLDKSVEDPFSKSSKRKIYYEVNTPPAAAIFTNKNFMKSYESERSGFVSNGVMQHSPIFLRRCASTGNTPSKLALVNNTEAEVNSNEVINTRRTFNKLLGKHKPTASFDEEICISDLPENMVFNNSEYRNAVENSTTGDHFDVHNRFLENRNIFLKFGPNANIPGLPGVTHIPWQHRTSRAERFKNFTQNQNSPKRLSDPATHCAKQKPSLLTFRSFDLGNEHIVGSQYCPQSEPVKRKVYTCSATFGKLQKSLLRKHSDRLSINNTSDGTNSENSRNNLKEKVAQLRKERLQIQSRVQETQDQIERLQLASDTTETG